MRRWVWGGVSAVLALWVVAACGGSTSNDSKASTGGGGAATGGAGSGGFSVGGSGGTVGGTGGTTASGGTGGVAASGGTGGLSDACPASRPTDGTACVMGAKLCPYNCADCICPDGTWTCKPHVCINPCNDFGEWCTDGAFQCQCWSGWSCQSTTDPNAQYDLTTLPTSVSDGQPCSNANLVCQPKGSAGASCHCIGGVWQCGAPVPMNTGCPGSFDQDQACSPKGLLCQKSGSCAPLCACTLQSTWDCVLFTPC